MNDDIGDEQRDDGPGPRYRTFRAGLTVGILLLLVVYFADTSTPSVAWSDGTSYKNFGGIRISQASLTIAELSLAIVTLLVAVAGYLQYGSDVLIPQVLRVLFTASPEASPPAITTSGQEEPADSAAATEQPPLTQTQLQDVDFHSGRIVGRLELEVLKLGRRNNINLLIGIAITATGIGALFYYVNQWQSSPVTRADMPWGMLNFLPRLSLVILIEIFAYFFLNLYRDGLAEVKYYQNEMTNIQARALALRSALRKNLPKAVDYSIARLAEVDRNAALQSGVASARQPNRLTLEFLRTAQEAIKAATKSSHSESSE